MQKGLWALALAAGWSLCVGVHGAERDTAPAGRDSTAPAGEPAAASAPGSPALEPALPEPFAEVPAPWRDYYRQAAAAECLGDRLQRCLAFPDLPGNRWPDGHAAAHCRYHALEPIALAEFEAALEQGTIAALESRLDVLLARHFGDGDGDGDGEDIHVALEAFGAADGETDRISARWLELAPGSAYANLARAEHLRGNDWVSKTPREQLRRMSELLQQAIPLFREAIRLQPRLMPAYAGLHDVAMLESRDDLQREALAGALAQDPACVEFARVRMHALQPRWGGSYEEMLGFAAELSRHLARRPQLAIHVAAPYGDRGDRLRGSGEYTRETVAVLDVAVRTGSNEAHLRDAAIVVLNLPEAAGGPDQWKGIALLLQEQRFNALNSGLHQNIARQVLPLDPEWGLRHALRAHELDPDDLSARFTLAMAYRDNRMPEQAEGHYLAAAQGEHRQGVLRDVATLWFRNLGSDRDVAAARAARAKPHIDRLLAEYPEDGVGWALRMHEHGLRGESLPAEAMRNFLKYADRDDPWQAEQAAQMEAELKRVGAPPELWRP